MNAKKIIDSIIREKLKVKTFKKDQELELKKLEEEIGRSRPTAMQKRKIKSLKRYIKLATKYLEDYKK